MPTHSKRVHISNTSQLYSTATHQDQVAVSSLDSHTLLLQVPSAGPGQHLNVFKFGITGRSPLCPASLASYISWQRGMDHEDLSSAEHKSKKFRIHNLSITYIVRTWHSLTLHASSPPTVTYQKLLTASSMLSQEKYKEYMKFVNVPPVCLFHTSIFV